MEGEYDYLFKILLIGDSSVGKTSLLLRYVDEKFTTEFQTTIGVDFKVNTLSVDGKKVKLQLWDTAGQDRFRNIVASYYRGAQGIILMYDITEPGTFQNIRKWNEEAQSYLQSSIPRLLVGNKKDMDHSRRVTFDEGQALADSLFMDFIETSAKSSENVQEAFLKMTKAIMDKSPAASFTTGSTTNPPRRMEGRSVRGGWCCGS